jgi:hypothetical protein
MNNIINIYIDNEIISYNSSNNIVYNGTNSKILELLEEVKTSGKVYFDYFTRGNCMAPIVYVPLDVSSSVVAFGLEIASEFIVEIVDRTKFQLPKKDTHILFLLAYLPDSNTKEGLEAIIHFLEKYNYSYELLC